MAQFTDITITRAGLDLIAKSQAGDNLIFTGIKIGDGQIRGQSIPDLTDLISVKKEIPIISVTAKNEGHVEILGIIDNEDISVGFFVREIGIYAKINEGGTPALYGYTNAGNYASYISDKSVPMDAFKFKIDLVVGNAANVSFVSDKSIVYVTQENLDAHNESEDSHPDIRKKITAHENRFELFEKIADFGNDIIKNMALTTAISAITALETNSWFGQLLKMVLTASGVKYNIAQNGYVCLGSFFGGLIIQWGSSAQKSVSNQNIEITQLFPIGMGQTLKAFTTIYDITKSKDYNGGIGADVTSYDNKGLTMVLDVSEIKSPRMCQIFFLALGI